MPTRHLSDEQRQRYASFAAAPSPDQLSRYFHLDRGDREIIDGLLGCLGLALNAVVHWNAIYMQEVIQQARASGLDVRDDDLAHLSPLIWRHLNFLGRYDFSLPDTVRNGGLRPLTNLKPRPVWKS